MNWLRKLTSSPPPPDTPPPTPATAALRGVLAKNATLTRTISSRSGGTIGRSSSNSSVASRDLTDAKVHTILPTTLRHIGASNEEAFYFRIREDSKGALYLAPEVASTAEKRLMEKAGNGELFQKVFTKGFDLESYNDQLFKGLSDLRKQIKTPEDLLGFRAVLRNMQKGWGEDTRFIGLLTSLDFQLNQMRDHDISEFKANPDANKNQFMTKLNEEIIDYTSVPKEMRGQPHYIKSLDHICKALTVAMQNAKTPEQVQEISELMVKLKGVDDGFGQLEAVRGLIKAQTGYTTELVQNMKSAKAEIRELVDQADPAQGRYLDLEKVGKQLKVIQESAKELGQPNHPIIAEVGQMLEPHVTKDTDLVTATLKDPKTQDPSATFESGGKEYKIGWQGVQDSSRMKIMFNGRDPGVRVLREDERKGGVSNGSTTWHFSHPSDEDRFHAISEEWIQLVGGSSVEEFTKVITQTVVGKYSEATASETVGKGLESGRRVSVDVRKDEEGLIQVQYKMILPTKSYDANGDPAPELGPGGFQLTSIYLTFDPKKPGTLADKKVSEQVVDEGFVSTEQLLKAEELAALRTNLTETQAQVGNIKKREELVAPLYEKAEALLAEQAENMHTFLGAGRIKSAEETIVSARSAVKTLLANVNPEKGVFLDKAQLMVELQKIKEASEILEQPDHPIVKEVGLMIRPYLVKETNFTQTALDAKVEDANWRKINVEGVEYTVPRQHVVDATRQNWKIDEAPPMGPSIGSIQDGNERAKIVDQKMHEIAKGDQEVMLGLTKIFHQGVGGDYLVLNMPENMAANRIANANSTTYELSTDDKGHLHANIFIPSTNISMLDPHAGPESYQQATLHMVFDLNRPGSFADKKIREEVVEEGFVTPAQLLGGEEKALAFSENLKQVGDVSAQTDEKGNFIGKSQQQISEEMIKETLGSVAAPLLAKQRETVRFFLEAATPESESFSNAPMRPASPLAQQK